MTQVSFEPQTFVVAALPRARTALVVSKEKVELKAQREAQTFGVVAGPTGQRGEPGTLLTTAFIQDDFVISAPQLADGEVSLSHAPANAAKVELSVYGGIEQRPNVDFVVTGQSLNWRGLALELLLDVGSALSVRYVSA